MSPLSPTQRRYLRSLGHHLQPLVRVGKAGSSASVVDALEQALIDHELVKVRLGTNSSEERHQVAEMLASATGAEVAQVLGNTILLYRQHPDEPTIRLPRAAAPAQ